MSNRTTLAQLAGMTKEEASALPISDLAMLLEDVTLLKAEAKASGDKLNGILDQRFSDAAKMQRSADCKDTGTVTILVRGFKIRADLPKKVEWEQSLLRGAVKVIEGWGENPAEYVTTEIKVSEAKYAAWPAGIRKIFEDARIVGVGSPTYKIERTKEAV